MPLCLTFTDLKKAFDSVEVEAVMEALDNQSFPNQCMKLSLQKTMFMRNELVSDAHTHSAERTYPKAPDTFIWVGKLHDERPDSRGYERLGERIGASRM
ncbi:hypothetical protein RB195_015135 [Necator americanus]|uniref:Reverse transcriptase domain-containing protein n=1 Tax=Necator americanus TaxID=51031 RepID=A0ABR1E351_NECAM